MENNETKEQPKEKVQVVLELPTQNYDRVPLEDGTTLRLLPLVDCITEMYNDIKEIKKAVI